jgi:hypothetical protein
MIRYLSVGVKAARLHLLPPEGGIVSANEIVRLPVSVLPRPSILASETRCWDTLFVVRF